MELSDYSLILGLLDSRRVPYVERSCSRETRKEFPTAFYEIEIENTSDYGEAEATSVWLFDLNGALLRIGHFTN